MELYFIDSLTIIIETNNKLNQLTQQLVDIFFQVSYNFINRPLRCEEAQKIDYH